jgi:hypothetical protein
LTAFSRQAAQKTFAHMEPVAVKPALAEGAKFLLLFTKKKKSASALDHPVLPRNDGGERRDLADLDIHVMADIVVDDRRCGTLFLQLS